MFSGMCDCMGTTSRSDDLGYPVRNYFTTFRGEKRRKSELCRLVQAVARSRERRSGPLVACAHWRGICITLWLITSSGVFLQALCLPGYLCRFLPQQVEIGNLVLLGLLALGCDQPRGHVLHHHRWHGKTPWMLSSLDQRAPMQTVHRFQ